jgi:peptide deformylase
MEMAIRNIRNNIDDNILLRKQSKRVESINHKVLILLEDMVETMYKEEGVGLAAPQIGILRRLVVIDIGTGLIKLINPEIIEQDGQQQGIEGCLSVPGVTGEVIRPQRVRISAQDETGVYIELEGSDLLARAICHEIDHLKGVLFIDKTVSAPSIDSDSYYRD